MSLNAELGRYFTNYVRKYIQDVHFDILMGFPGGSEGKELACNAGDLGSTLGWEDPLEKGMITDPSVPAWEIPWTEEPGRL